MAMLLQADQPVEEVRDALAGAVLEAARELRIGERDGHLLVRDGVTECELQRRDREGVCVRFPCEEGDETRTGVFKRQQRANYGWERLACQRYHNE